MLSAQVHCKYYASAAAAAGCCTSCICSLFSLLYSLMNKLNSVQVGPLGWQWARSAALRLLAKASSPTTSSWSPTLPTSGP